MVKVVIVSSLISFFSMPTIEAATIKGTVKDSINNELCIGATIEILNQNSKTMSGLDGSFVLKNIPVGNYTLQIKNEGFKTQRIDIQIVEKDQVLILRIQSNPEIKEEDVISVVGKRDNESDKTARNSEKNADNITNSISGKTMQLLPDITVANVLQRVSGISVERSSSGDGRYAIVRGMDQRYNYTLVNGIKIPSPDNKNRYVPMDIFPSELLERLEVIKALTPSMEGDAIGGAVNMIMKSAPDELMINANIGTGFSQLLAQRGYSHFNPQLIAQKSPAQLNGLDYLATPNDFSYSNFSYRNIGLPLNSIAGLSIGNRFFKKKLGIIVGGSCQNTYRGSTSVFIKPNTQPAAGNVAQFDDLYVREYSTQQIRAGVHSKIDYKINSKHKLSLYTVYMNLKEIETRHTDDTSLSLGRNSVGTGNVYMLDRSRYQVQSIYNTTLQGEHSVVKSFKINWSAVYSKAQSNVPDWSEIEYSHTVTKDNNGVQSADAPKIRSFARRWQRNADEDKSGYLSISWAPKKYPRRMDTLLRKLAFSDLEVSVGGLNRNKTRANYYNEYNLIPKNQGGIVPAFDGNLNANDFLFFDAAASQGSPVNPNTYKAYENIFAYYWQVKFMLFQKVQILGGARTENTSQNYKTVMNPQTFVGASGSTSYTDLLPSLHVKCKINKNQNLRFSYFKSINRPSFFEKIPYNIQGNLTITETGNPYLKHCTADNYDARYELFPKGLDQLLIGVFYKNLTNPIETAFLKSGTSGSILQPSNFGNATNCGFEFVLTKYWGHFGITSNYTYTDSKITTPKAYYYRDANNQLTTSLEMQTRPLQGQSKHIANLSVLYKNPKIGLDLQLAMVYTGRKIVMVSPYKDMDYWQRGVTQLDFSFEKRFLKVFYFYLKATNLLNTPVIVEILQPNTYLSGKYELPFQTRSDRILVQKDYYQQNYLFGIRYKL